MKIDNESLSYIKNVVDTAQMIGIDGVVIEPGKVRAMHEDKTVVMFQDENVPEMPFTAVGLNRLSVFAARLDVAKTMDKFAIDVKTNDNSEFARSFTMTGKGFKVDYRCANPKTIIAPQKINDEMIYKIELTPEAVYLLQRGQTAMGADVVSLICNSDGVTFELQDVNSDKFSHTFTDEVEKMDGADDSFTYKYPIKVLLPLFKENAENVFEIGKKGMLRITVNNITLFILPQV